MLDNKNSFEEKYASLIQSNEEQLKDYIEFIAYSRDLEEKKKKAKELADKIGDLVKQDNEKREAIFYLLSKKFLTPGWFISGNDADNIDAVIYFYSNFPGEFINYAFENLKNKDFDKQILHYYCKTLVRISKANDKNREIILRKIKEMLLDSTFSREVVRAKILVCISAIALRATTLLNMLESVKNNEKNEELKTIYNSTINLIKKHANKVNS